MANSFYIDFDEALLETRPDDQRTRFQRDRDRILHSFAFRRLQSKTQVFWTGEYDFYRTRLTHSIEVSQIGRSICDHLKRQSSLLSETFYIDQDLVEAVCLAHDLGHPLFGHANERLLNHLMRRYGGFEANAQTLRIITEIFYSNKEERSGMAPTRALVDGVMKYKTLHSQLNPAISQFIYDEQQKYLDFVFDNRPIPGNITPGEKLNSFRSIECQIMDWADDIAFSLNDFTDCVHAGLITIDNVKKWVKENSVTSSLNPVIYKLVAAMEKGDVERKLAADIGKFIRGCNLKKTNNFMSDRTNRYSFQLTVKSNIMKEKDLYKHMCDDLVFKSPQIRQLEYKSKYILSQLFKAFNSNYINKLSPGALLLPADTERTICGLPSKRERARVICDYISGMSDSFSIRVYKRLLDPDFGSILDLV